MAETTGSMTLKSTDPERDVTELRDSISQTRQDMGRTVNAIEERLSPARLKEQVLEQFNDAREKVKTELQSDYAEIKHKVQDEIGDAKHAVREATIGRVEHMIHSAGDSVSEVRTTVFDTIRANPIPAAMLGIGLGWLLMNARSSSSRNGIRVREVGAGRRDDRSQYGYGGRSEASGYYSPYAGPRERETASMGGIKSTAAHVAHDAGEAVGNAAHRAGDAMSHLVHGAREQASHLAQGARELAHDASDGASHYASEARDGAMTIARDTRQQAVRLEHRIERAMQENPLAFAAVTLVIGAAIGLALPSTPGEDNLLGSVRDDLVDRAGEAAHHAADKAKEVAKDVGSEAKRIATEAVGGEGGAQTPGQAKNGHSAARSSQQSS